MRKISQGLAMLLGLFLMTNLAFADDVTFKVDMRVMLALGLYDSTAQDVRAVGSFQGWNAGDAATTLSDSDGDGIYVGTFDAGTDTVEFKYVVVNGGTTWEDNVTTNRMVVLTGSAVELDTVEWNNGARFSVDMSSAILDGIFDPATQSLSVAGTFNDWGGTAIGITDGDSATLAEYNLTDDDGDSVYTGIGNISPPEVAYKHVITNQSDGKIAAWESHPDRSVSGVGESFILGTPNLPTYPWDGDPGETVESNITFFVDLRVMEAVDLFDPTTSDVKIAGSFQGWDTGSVDHFLTDDDNDFVYTGTFNVGDVSPIEYKFIVVEGEVVTWEDNLGLEPNPPSGGNRSLAHSGDAVLDTLEWNNGATFQVDMSVPLEATGNVTFNPDTQFVSVAGSFNDWGGTGIGITDGDSATLAAYMLQDSDGDSIYTGNHPISPPPVAYKHVIVNKSDGKIASWEGHPDREIIFVDIEFTLGTPILPVLPWDGDPGATGTGTVLFQVDISPLKELGIFDESEGDTLQVRGGFNSWSDAEPENSIMRQSFIDPDIYELPVTMTLTIGTEQEYKFFIDFNPERAIWGGQDPFSGWEEPASTGGGNRIFVFSGEAEQTLDIQTFNDIFNVIPEGTSVTMNFTADMRCFLRNPENADADVTTDTLRLDIQDAVWHHFNGTLPYHDNIFNVPDSLTPTPFDFQDADGDSIYNLSLTVSGPIQNWVQYHLNWQGIDDAAPGFSVGRRRVRYVRPDESGDFAASYDFGVDYISEEIAPLLVEDPDGETLDDEAPCDVVTSVEQIASAIPDDYHLGQNYPNPFNPTTTIEYRLKKAGPVTLTIFNMRGQLVEELVDEHQLAGTYKVTVDISTMSASGVYFYRLKTPEFTQTRMMTLLK